MFVMSHVFYRLPCHRSDEEPHRLAILLGLFGDVVDDAAALPNSVKRSDRTDPIIGYLLREAFIRCEYGKYGSLPWWTRWKLSGLPQVP